MFDVELDPPFVNRGNANDHTVESLISVWRGDGERVTNLERASRREPPQSGDRRHAQQSRKRLQLVANRSANTRVGSERGLSDAD